MAITPRTHAKLDEQTAEIMRQFDVDFPDAGAETRQAWEYRIYQAQLWLVEDALAQEAE